MQQWVLLEVVKTLWFERLSTLAQHIENLISKRECRCVLSGSLVLSITLWIRKQNTFLFFVFRVSPLQKNQLKKSQKNSSQMVDNAPIESNYSLVPTLYK